VQDSGKGIEAAKLQNIFDPFFTTKEPGKGTGLGLSVVQTIISAHGGFIEVKSHPGLGTTFFVYLPISGEKPEEIVPAERFEAVPPEQCEEAKVVLIVEDEAGLRELLQQYLSENGIKVITACDGEEGLRAYKDHPEISLIISDLGLPKLTGDKLIAKIKEIRPAAKCVLATGYLDSAAGHFLSGFGVKTIMKPYDLSAVYKLILEAIPKKK
jgi:CheY-like chemotaxis protein